MIEDIIMMFFKRPQNLNNVFFSNYVVGYQQSDMRNFLSLNN